MIRKHNIFLLRERTEYNFEQTDDEYISLSIQLLKKYMIETIQIPDIQISNNHLINDYLFLCFLVGNDFIHNLPSINIRYNGIQNLIMIYQNLQRKYLGQFYLLDNSFHISFVTLSISISRIIKPRRNSYTNNSNHSEKTRTKNETHL